MTDFSMLHVSCAIITDSTGEVLVTQRSGTMSMPFKWEFPGGKVESGESAEQCLIREIKEELNVDVLVLRQLKQNIHRYSTITIRLIPFICSIRSGQIHLREHMAYRWVSPGDLLNLDWAEADIACVTDYLEYIRADKEV